MKNVELYDKIVLEKVRQGDQSAFSILFSAYYRDLTIFASRFTHNVETSEEIVQDVFVQFWENREALIVSSSLKSYLLKIVQNRCFDLKRHQKVKDSYSGKVLSDSVDFDYDTENYILYSQLEEQVKKAISELPDDYAKAFRMNRFDGLTYTEIAEKTGVSVRTIEVRIGKALAMLREKLNEYFIFALFFLSDLFR